MASNVPRNLAADLSVVGSMTFTGSLQLDDDSEAWDGSIEAVYTTEYRPMVRLAYLILGSEQLAEEIVHDAFAELIERRARVREPGAYLRRAVVNRCNSRLRRFAVERRYQERHPPEAHVEAATEPLLGLLAQLPQRQRAAVVMRFYLDASEAEIAAALDARPGTVKSLIHRGLAALRTEFATMTRRPDLAPATPAELAHLAAELRRIAAPITGADDAESAVNRRLAGRRHVRRRRRVGGSTVAAIGLLTARLVALRPASRSDELEQQATPPATSLAAVTNTAGPASAASVAAAGAIVDDRFPLVDLPGWSAAEPDVATPEPSPNVVGRAQLFARRDGDGWRDGIATWWSSDAIAVPAVPAVATESIELGGVTATAVAWGPGASRLVDIPVGDAHLYVAGRNVVEFATAANLPASLGGPLTGLVAPPGYEEIVVDGLDPDSTPWPAVYLNSGPDEQVVEVFSMNSLSILLAGSASIRPITVGSYAGWIDDTGTALTFEVEPNIYVMVTGHDAQRVAEHVRLVDEATWRASFETPISQNASVTQDTQPERRMVGGDSGDDVRAVEQRLADLGFMPGEIDGVFDQQTRSAVWAFEKLLLGTPYDEVTGIVDDSMRRSINVAVRPLPHRPGIRGRHVEVYLDRQVLVVFQADEPVLISHLSSGSGEAFTEEVTIDEGQPGNIDGPGRVTRQVSGVADTRAGAFRISGRYTRGEQWKSSPLGRMYKPQYFNDGQAIHGSDDVPARPVSHGAIRVPMHVANTLADMLEIDRRRRLDLGRAEGA